MARIHKFGCATCNRPSMLKRCLSSYLEGCIRQETEIVVADDSSSASMRQRNRAEAADLCRRFGVGIFYAGFEEKAIYAKRLMNVARGAAASIRFALFGGGIGGTSIGSSRNALLLEMAGGLGVTVDDDIVCRLHAAPGVGQTCTGLTHGAGPAREIWCFEDRETLLGWLVTVAEAFLAPHEPYLGTALDNGSGTPERIAITLTGFAGDCASDSAAPLLFAGETTFDRVLSSEQAYASATASREQLHITPSLRVTDSGSEVMAGCMGLDLSRMCPPFVPNGRGEDALFGATLTACWPSARIAHLPVAVLHAPEHPRAFAAVDSIRRNLTVLTLVSSCMSSFDLESAHAGMERLVKLGRHLQSVGSSPVHRLAGQVLDSARLQWNGLLRTLEMRLDCRPGPACWNRDAHKMMRALRTAIADDQPLTPTEFGAGLLEEGYESARLFLRGVGDLFVAWPEIMEAARRLHHNGVRLASAVIENRERTFACS
jgi:hypothetical protein